MKKNIIICLLLPLLLAGCQLYESPGEEGVDPTQVTVMANIMVSLTIPQNEMDAVKAATRAEESMDYRHRFIVEAYIDGVSLHREVFYAELTSQSTLTVPVSLNLHARHYRLAVWSDYVKTTEDENPYYNCEILDPVTMNAPSPGNTEYKDAFFVTQELNLTPYADEWNVIVPVDVELIRPVARYELIATDMAAFRTRMKEAGMENDEFCIRVKYANYRYMGFDLLQQHPKHALMYMSYKKELQASGNGYQGVHHCFRLCICHAQPAFRRTGGSRYHQQPHRRGSGALRTQFLLHSRQKYLCPQQLLQPQRRRAGRRNRH